MQAETRALWRIYHDEIPPILRELMQTPPMQRLQTVGMNCGCEYTRFPRFLQLRPYSRFDHSVGVGLIVWHFTQDEKQAAAGLLHDVATPTFSHVVDFLRGDHLTQESTEAGTEEMIDACTQIQDVLQTHGLTTGDVCDYHRYPIADNDSPRLSADRLEYTLGNILSFNLGDCNEVQMLYEDIRVGENEIGQPELVFLHAERAAQFAARALTCSRVYVSDEDRYAMQMLAELLKDAIDAGILSEYDLMGDEPRLLEKLCRTPIWRARWEAFCAMHALERTDTPAGDGWRRIDAKRRCIDPLIAGQGRVSACDPAFGAALDEFRTASLDVWLRGKA